MRKTPEKQAEGIESSPLYKELCDFLDTFPKSTERFEDYKQFLDRVSQIPAEITKICKKARNTAELNILVLGVMQLLGDGSKMNLEGLKAHNVPSKPNHYFHNCNKLLQIRAYITASESIKCFRGIQPVTENEINKINSALGEISHFGFFGDTSPEELTSQNNHLQTVLDFYAVREMPTSYIIELPFISKDGKKVWVVFERNFSTGKMLYSLFFGDKEPTERKLDIIKTGWAEKNIEGPVFRDQVGVFSNALGNDIHHSSSLKFLLGDNFEKLRALILLGIAPVILRKEVTEDIYQSYGVSIKEGPENHNKRYGDGSVNPDTVLSSKIGDSLLNSDDTITHVVNTDSEIESDNKARNYPYDSSLKIKVLSLLEDDDTEKREINPRVIHKRLLPDIKRADGTYISAKPSKKALSIARERGFSLEIGIGFPKKGKCIYPEKVPELLRQLGVNTLEEALEKLKLLGETGTLRYETLVVPSQESPNEVQKNIRAKVGNITNQSLSMQ